MNIPLLPKSLKVAAFDIAVEELPSAAGRAGRRVGEFSSHENVVRIQLVDQSKWDVLDSMMHEVGHIIYWAYGIEDEDKEERIVKTYATAWAQVYRDNRDLVEWIYKIVTPEPEFK